MGGGAGATTTTAVLSQIQWHFALLEIPSTIDLAIVHAFSINVTITSHSSKYIILYYMVTSLI
jgi:hypothetical protein